MTEMTGTSEPPCRLNIKQTAKGEKYWDITARGKTSEICEENFNKMKAFAEKECRKPEEEG